jgi:hypothetical protein
VFWLSLKINSITSSYFQKENINIKIIEINVNSIFNNLTDLESFFIMMNSIILITVWNIICWMIELKQFQIWWITITIKF